MPEFILNVQITNTTEAEALTNAQWILQNYEQIHGGRFAKSTLLLELNLYFPTFPTAIAAIQAMRTQFSESLDYSLDFRP